MTHTILQFPKLLALAFCFLLAGLLYVEGALHTLAEALNGQGYISIFLAGLLFSTAFTTPFAIGMFVELSPHVNPTIAAPIGAVGAMLADLCIFTWTRLSLHEEFHRLWRLPLPRRIGWYFHNHRLLRTLRPYILWSLAGFIIASPLPDELGVTLLSSVTDVRSRPFALFCFGLNAVGIFLVLVSTRALL